MIRTSCENLFKANPIIDPTNVREESTDIHSMSVGQNDFSLSSPITVNSGQIIVIKILSGKLAINTTSAKSDYELISTNATDPYAPYKMQKLNSQSDWRFCFKIFVKRNYKEKIYKITHRFKQNIYHARCFRLDANNNQIFKAKYRYVGN